MVTDIAVAAFWLLCSIVTYGITKAYFCRCMGHCVEDPQETAGCAIAFALCGPVTLPLSFLLSGFAKYGLKFNWK